MSEVERLREALRDMLDLSVEDDSMWELHETSFQARRRAARNALAAKPEVCAWDMTKPHPYYLSCNADLPGWLISALMAWLIDHETRCPGCGRKIEVRS